MQKNKLNPLITVIIPSYNHAQYILNAIESVKNQTYSNWELIIIDDGSTDNTHEVLESMEKNEKIILILNKDNKRQSARLNQAIQLAKGQYISLLASDDWYLPTKLEKQINLFSLLPNDFGIVYSGGYRYFEDTEILIEVETNKIMKRGNILKNLLTEPFFIYPISPLIKKSCYNNYSYDESYSAEGEAIYFKFAMKFKFDFIDEPLVVMREHTYNIGGNTEKMLVENIRYRKELFKNKDFPIELKYLLKPILSKIYKVKGFEYIKLRKEYQKGRESLFNAIKNNLLYILNYKVLIAIIITFLPKFIIEKILK